MKHIPGERIVALDRMVEEAIATNGIGVSAVRHDDIPLVDFLRCLRR